MALYVTQTYPNADVWVNDLYYPLYAFWRTLRDHGQQLCDDLRELKTELGESEDAHRIAFDNAKDKLNNDLYESGFNFYVANKCSFSGLTANSSFSKQASRANFTFRGIDKLPALGELIQGWRITNQSYEESLYGRNAFVFLDPPYAIKDNLYGNKGDMHKSFDHEWFASQACASEQDCMITYNSELFIKDRFPDWYQKDWDLTYTMRSSGTYTKDQKKRKELLLLNYEQQTSLIGLFKEHQRDEAELTG